jgi:hypothetical protein
VITFALFGYLVLGLVLTIWAAPLSVRYNAWTTAFRERNPHISKPPTPEMKAHNTKIMTRHFRGLGIVFIACFSLMLLVGLLNSQ